MTDEPPKHPPPDPDLPKIVWHKHKYYDHNDKRWHEENCSCATGKYHVTPKD